MNESIINYSSQCGNVLNSTGFSDLSISKVTVRSKKNHRTADLTTVDKSYDKGNDSTVLFDSCYKNSRKKHKKKCKYLYNTEESCEPLADIPEHDEDNVQNPVTSTNADLAERFNKRNSVSVCALDNQDKLSYIDDLTLQTHKKKLNLSNEFNVSCSLGNSEDRYQIVESETDAYEDPHKLVYENLNEQKIPTEHENRGSVVNLDKTSNIDVGNSSLQKHKKKHKIILSDANEHDLLGNSEDRHKKRKSEKKLRKVYSEGDYHNKSNSHEMHRSEANKIEILIERNSIAGHCSKDMHRKNVLTDEDILALDKGKNKRHKIKLNLTNEPYTDEVCLTQQEHKKEKHKRKLSLIIEGNESDFVMTSEDRHENRKRVKKLKTDSMEDNQDNNANLYEDVLISKTTLNEINPVDSHSFVETSGTPFSTGEENLVLDNQKKKKLKRKLTSKAKILNSESGHKVENNKETLKANYCAEDHLNDKYYENQLIPDSADTETFNQDKKAYTDENIVINKRKKKRHRSKLSLETDDKDIGSLKKSPQSRHETKKSSKKFKDIAGDNSIGYSKSGMEIVDAINHLKKDSSKVISEKFKSDISEQQTSKIKKEKKNNNTNEMRNDLLQNALSIFMLNSESSTKHKAHSKPRKQNKNSNVSVVSPREKIIKSKKKKKRKQDKNNVENLSLSNINVGVSTIGKEQSKSNETISEKEDSIIKNDRKLSLLTLKNTCDSPKSIQKIKHNSEIEKLQSLVSEKDKNTHPIKQKKKKKHKSKDKGKTGIILSPKKKKKKKQEIDPLEAMTSKLLSIALKSRSVKN